MLGVAAGFTVFLERKIIGRLHGEQALQFHAANGYLSLVDSIHQIGDTHNFTALVPDLSGGVDPDDSFSKVPYEKGFYFLYYLQVMATLQPPCPHHSCGYPISAGTLLSCVISYCSQQHALHAALCLHIQRGGFGTGSLKVNATCYKLARDRPAWRQTRVCYCAYLC